MKRIRWVAAGVGVLAVMAAIGAGLTNNNDGGDEDSATAGSSAEFAEGGGLVDAVAPDAASDQGADVSFTAGAGSRASTTIPILEQGAVIRTGSIALVTPDLVKAQDEIRVLLSSLGGYLASENTQASEDGQIRNAALVLRVPSEDFDPAMERLAGIGKVSSRTQSAKDVTREVADVDSRVSSAQAALERIRLLLDRAESLGTVIRLESVLSDRQAALESLMAQQKALASQTQLSTIDVSLSAPSRIVPKPKPEPDDSGFVAGLRSGWDAFTTMISGIATAAGALLPFTVLLVLLGIPAWLFTRRFRTGRAQTG